ncbi:MAG: toll/interleukin-1 receptor domain-containing protein [Acidimicrobiales bacterium]
MPEPRRCFVSYARSDDADAAVVASHLEWMGHTVWRDEDLHGGQPWWDTILREIRACDCFVFVQSAASCRSPACLAELDYAHRQKRPIVPVRLAGPSRPPDFVGEIEWVDAADQPELRAALGRALYYLPPAPPLAESEPEPPMPVPTDGDASVPRGAAPRARPRRRWIVLLGIAVLIAAASPLLIDNLERAVYWEFGIVDVLAYLALSVAAAGGGYLIGSAHRRPPGGNAVALAAGVVACSVAALVLLAWGLLTHSYALSFLLVGLSVVAWGLASLFGFAAAGRTIHRR